MALVAGLVDQVGAVQVQHVEQEHRQRDDRVGSALAAARGARRGHLERVGPAVGAQRDQLAVEDGRAYGQGAERGDGLGQPGGDVVEGAGEQRPRRRARATWTRTPSSFHSIAAGPVFASAAATSGALRRASGVRAGPPPGRTRAARRGARSSAAAATAASAPREHHGAAYLGRRDLGGGGDGVGHHAVEGALAQFAGEQPDQEPVLAGGGAAEQPGEQISPRGHGTLTRCLPISGERGVGLG